MDKRTDIRPVSDMDDGERTHLGVCQGSGKNCGVTEKSKSLPNNNFQYNKRWKISMGKLIIMVFVLVVCSTKG